MLLDNRRKIRRITIKCVNISLFLLALNFLAGNLGLFASPLISRIAAFYLMIGLALFNFSLKKIPSGKKISYEKLFNKNLIVGVLLLIVSLLILFLFDKVELWLLSFSIYIFGLDLSFHSNKDILI